MVDIQWTGRGPLAGRKDGWSKTSETDRFKNTSRGQHDATKLISTGERHSKDRKSSDKA